MNRDACLRRSDADQSGARPSIVIFGPRRLEMTVRVLDPEGAHLAALLRLGDFHGLRVLELGCGDGRLTVDIAVHATSVLAFDPDAAAIDRARHSLPVDLAGRIDYRVASGTQIALEPRSFDVAVFSWSL